MLLLLAFWVGLVRGCGGGVVLFLLSKLYHFVLQRAAVCVLCHNFEGNEDTFSFDDTSLSLVLLVN